MIGILIKLQSKISIFRGPQLQGICTQEHNENNKNELKQHSKHRLIACFKDMQNVKN